MTRSEVTTLSVRLIALYVWVQALLLIASITVFLGSWPDGESSRGMLSGAVTAVALACSFGGVLFAQAPALGRRVSQGQEPFLPLDGTAVGSLALRLAGVLLFDQALRTTSTLVAAQQLESRFGSELFSTLLLAGGGAALFLSAQTLGRWMFGRRSASGDAALRGFATIQAAAFAVVGIWVAADALPTIVTAIAGSFQRSDLYGLDASPSVAPAVLWTQIARAVLGLALFFGGAGLSVFWYWIQHAGLRTQRQRLESNGKNA